MESPVPPVAETDADCRGVSTRRDELPLRLRRRASSCACLACVSFSTFCGTVGGGAGSILGGLGELNMGSSLDKNVVVVALLVSVKSLYQVTRTVLAGQLESGLLVRKVAHVFHHRRLDVTHQRFDQHPRRAR